MMDNIYTVTQFGLTNIPYDLHMRNHSYILWIVIKRRYHLQILHVGTEIVLVG